MIRPFAIRVSIRFGLRHLRVLLFVLAWLVLLASLGGRTTDCYQRIDFGANKTKEVFYLELNHNSHSQRSAAAAVARTMAHFYSALKLKMSLRHA